MHVSRRTILGCATLICIGGAAHADAAGEARAAIQSAHARIDLALALKDPAGATASCAPDFVSINKEGQRFTAAQVRQDLTQSFRRAGTVQSQTMVQKLMLTPAGATVTVMQHMNIVSPYKVLFVHRVAHTTLDQGRNEIWVKKGDAWLLNQSKTFLNESHTRL